MIWKVRSAMLGNCIIWLPEPATLVGNSIENVGYFQGGESESMFIYVVADTGGLAIRAAQEALRAQTSYIGPSY